MKNSRVSYQNKLPPKQYQPPPQSRIASLKAIMSTPLHSQTKAESPSHNTLTPGPKSTTPHNLPRANPTSSISSFIKQTQSHDDQLICRKLLSDRTQAQLRRGRTRQDGGRR